MRDSERPSRDRKTRSAGIILPFLLRLADRIGSAAKNSLIGSFLTGYTVDRDQGALSSSLLLKPIRSLSLGERLFRPARFAVAGQFDRSAVLGALTAFGKMLAGSALSTFGIGFLLFSFFSGGVYVLSNFFRIGQPKTAVHLVFTVSSLLIGILLVASRRHFSEALSESRLGSLLFGFLGLRAEVFRAVPLCRGPAFLTAAAGMVIGILSAFFSPYELFIGCCIPLLGFLVFYLPEAGLILGVFLLPFFSTMSLVVYTMVLVISYGIKVLRGKRLFSMSGLDAVVLLFALVLLGSGVFSASPSTSLPSAAVFLCFLCWYPLAVNLLRSPDWIHRAVKAVFLASLFVSLYGIAQYLFSDVSRIWLDSELFSDIAGRAVSTFENPNVLGEYLLLCLPVSFSLFLDRTKSTWNRFLLLLGSGCLLVCLILTWSRGAWLGLLLSSGILCIIVSARMLLLLFPVACLLPWSPAILPSSVVQRFLSIGNLADTSTSYRIHIWEGVLRMLKDHWIAGIGIGVGAFREVYPAYSLSGIEAAPHSHSLYLQVLTESGVFGLVLFLLFLVFYARCCISSVTLFSGFRYRLRSACICCGVFAVLIQGMTDYIWYNYRVFLMFWFAIGLSVSFSRCVSRKISSQEKAEPNTEANASLEIEGVL